PGTGPTAPAAAASTPGASPPSRSRSFTGASMSRILHPIGDEDVRLARPGLPAVRREDELRTVRAEHREPVEVRAGRDPLQLAGLDVHQVQVELAARRVRHVRA